MIIKSHFSILYFINPQTTPNTTQPQTPPPTSESALLASLLGPAQTASIKIFADRDCLSVIRFLWLQALKATP